MKKVLLTLCVACLVAMTACKKDDPEPNNNPSGPEQPEVIDGDGVFMPAMKIAQVHVDGELNEEWEWDNDGLLTSIMKADEYGNMMDAGSFTYQNSRLHQANSTIQGIPVTIAYDYRSKWLASLSANSGFTQVLTASVDHNADNKITHLTFDVNSDLLAMLSGFLGGGGFFKATKEAGRKVAVNSTDISIDMDWVGDNVSQQRLSADVDGSVTLGELRTLMNLDSMLGPMGAIILATIPDTTSFPVQISIRDTISMTYDNHPNPFCGFIGSLENLSLSANNVVTSTTAIAASATITFLSFQLPFPLPIPIESGTVNYDYTYNPQGFPLTRTDDEGTVTQYTYLQ